MQQHFTPPRLATLQTFFKATETSDLMGCYAWNQAVGASLFPLLGDFEVVLRNALHRALSNHYGNVDSMAWMLPRANPAHAANPLAPVQLPSVHSLVNKTRLELIDLRDKILQRKPHGYFFTPDDIVANVHFGFWDNLIFNLSHNSHPNGLQQKILSSAFPNAPVSSQAEYGTQIFKKKVCDLLKRFRDIRNRVGHHDSLWKISEFNQSGMLGFTPTRPRQSINSLRILCERLTWFLDWIDPEISNYIKRSDHWMSMHALLSRNALTTYRMTGGEVGTYKMIIDRNIHHSKPRKTGRVINRMRANSFHF